MSAVSDAAELAGHSDTVACLDVDPTGEVIATGGMDGFTRLWYTSSGKPAGVLEGPGEAIEWLAWHPKGTVLAVGSQDMSAWMYNAQQQQCMQVFTGHSGPVMAGAHPTHQLFPWRPPAVDPCSVYATRDTAVDNQIKHACHRSWRFRRWATGCPSLAL